MNIRGREEVLGALQTFKDVYESQFNKPLNYSEALGIVLEILEEKQRQVIKQRFMDFHPHDLMTVIAELRSYAHKNAVSEEITLQEPKRRGRPKNDKR